MFALRSPVSSIAVVATFGFFLFAACGEPAEEPNGDNQLQQNDDNDANQQNDDNDANQQNDDNDANQQNDDNDEEPADYASIWAELDDEYGCAGCHGSSAADINSREMVVDIGSDCDGDVLRVDPGNPEESLLWRKITPDLGANEVCGGKMPPTGGDVTADDAQLVYDWIDDGAGE